jgi:hypothetical protein
MQSDIKQIISNPKNSYFRKKLLSATGLALLPACQETAKDKSSCDASLIVGYAKILNDLIYGWGGYGGLQRNQQKNIMDLSLVVGDDISEALVKKYQQKISDQLSKREVVGKIKNKIFPGIKQAMLKKISELNIDNSVKKKMLEKVQAISFRDASCDDKKNSNSISHLYISNAFYSPLNNSFQVCNGLLMQSDSEFALGETIAHELSHSIDPCGISVGPSDFGFTYKPASDFHKLDFQYPMPGVLSCLRSPLSVEARPLVPALPSSKSNMQVPAQYYSHCNGQDQIGESFADWFAYEVLPEYMSTSHPELTKEQYQLGYANAGRLFCSEAAANPTDPHPDGEKRVNRIALANPKMRKQMGCPEIPSHTIYCDPTRGFADNVYSNPQEYKSVPADKKGVQK